MSTKHCLLAFIFVYLSSFATAEEQPKCPSEAVDFWQKYARKTSNDEGVPGYLLKNKCIDVDASTLFSTTFAQRLDNPQQQNLVDILYSELTWTDGYDYEQ